MFAASGQAVGVEVVGGDVGGAEGWKGGVGGAYTGDYALSLYPCEDGCAVGGRGAVRCVSRVMVGGPTLEGRRLLYAGSISWFVSADGDVASGRLPVKDESEERLRAGWTTRVTDQSPGVYTG